MVNKQNLPANLPSLPASAMTPYRLFLLTSLMFAAAAAGVKDDNVRCLRGVTAALSEPTGSIKYWDFTNTTTGFICRFAGVSCWNPFENRVLGLSLNFTSLSGSIPSGLKYCSSLNSLDMSSNSLSGPIPEDICTWLPFVVSLDLSANQLSGSIPHGFMNCQYLNFLNLSNNQLSGAIPNSLGDLERLDYLDLSYNQLSGPVPPFLSGDPATTASFSHLDISYNPSLHGHPLSLRIIIMGAGIFGATAFILLVYVVWHWQASHTPRASVSVALEDGRYWVEQLSSPQNRLVTVTLFREPIIKVKLIDLLTATKNFHPDNILTIGNDHTGTTYKAVLLDGSALAIKRLCHCQLTEEQFCSDMARISLLRHPNLVSLLGFCIVEDEHFLIYKHMPNGTLSASLLSLDWPSRLRIGVATAHGLAWLHHGFMSPLLHQNLNSNSVLLDEDNEPRITEFDLTGLTSSMHLSVANCTLTGFGKSNYLAQEYATSSVPTTKQDVYDLGVILLELTTGNKPTEISRNPIREVPNANLVHWVNQLLLEGRIQDVVDESLRKKRS